MKPKPPTAVKFFIGALYSDAALLKKAETELVRQFGKIDYRSPAFAFDVSDYYRREMGSSIARIFFSFEKKLDPAKLVEMKLLANRIEQKLAVKGKRKVNLDPGYMDFNKVVLASAKANAQKVYLGDGIYADPTLWYEKGRFHPYERAFPDFKSGQYEITFLQIRFLLKAKTPD